MWDVAELNCFWGEQLGVGFGLPPERGCDHTLGTGAGLVTITTLVVRQPLDMASQRRGPGVCVVGDWCLQRTVAGWWRNRRPEDRGAGPLIKIAFLECLDWCVCQKGMTSSW